MILQHIAATGISYDRCRIVREKGPACLLSLNTFSEAYLPFSMFREPQVDVYSVVTFAIAIREGGRSARGVADLLAASPAQAVASVRRRHRSAAQRSASSGGKAGRPFSGTPGSEIENSDNVVDLIFQRAQIAAAV